MARDCGCPKIKKSDWDLKKKIWRNKAFYVTRFGVLLHMPIGIGSAIKKGWRAIKGKKYKVASPYIMLQEETSPFTGKMLIEIKNLPKNKNVELWKKAVLYSKYYKGPFRGLSKAVKELTAYVQKKEKKKPKKIYIWTVNCPKCWEKDGIVNVVFAKV